MAAAWLLFPLVMLGLCAGSGLLAERLAGGRFPGLLILPVGLAVMVAIAGPLTRADATAELATPACIVAALAGLLLGYRRIAGIDRAAALAAAAAFITYGAPVLASGQPTFTGYIKLDDTATWFAFIDALMSHGRDFAGLAPSSFETTLAVNFRHGYPVGALLPWGVGRSIVGMDVAWLFQPYLAFTGAMLTLVCTALARGTLGPTRLAAAAGFAATQSALLVGYTLWGGVKEIVAALLVALAAALVPWTLLESVPGVRRLVPIAVVMGAVLLSLSVAGGVWMAAALVAGVVIFVARTHDRRRALRLVGVFVAVSAMIAFPALLSARTFLAGTTTLQAATAADTGDALGNLTRALPLEQIVGIWPAGDFRNEPAAGFLTRVLIAIAVAAAIAGAIAAVRRRGLAILLYALTALVACVPLIILGSPWVDAKAMATASPVFFLLAAVAAAHWLQRGRRLPAAAVAAVVLGGAAWSHALAYREINLAPYEQLRELEQIGDAIRGEGPTLMTEYQPYGVRHFLRHGDAEGASELRRRQVPLRNGEVVRKAGFADIDAFQDAALAPYRTLVLRRSPTASRPPSRFRLARQGRWYEVWQRAAGAPVVEHLPLGDDLEPAGQAPCSEVRRLAALAGAGGRLATVFRAPRKAVALFDLAHPSDWRLGATPYVVAAGAGTVEGSVEAPNPGTYEFWIGGSFRGSLDLLVDGAKVGERSHVLSYAGSYTPFGGVTLSPGAHRVELRHHVPPLRPGTAGEAYPLGPLVLAPDTAAVTVSYVPVANATSLCGKSLDWIEALPAA